MSSASLIPLIALDPIPLPLISGLHPASALALIILIAVPFGTDAAMLLGEGPLRIEAFLAVAVQACSSARSTPEELSAGWGNH